MNQKKQHSTYAAGLQKQTQEFEKSSIVFWLLSTITVVFLFWSPFQRGLFNGNNFDFEAPIYSSFVWSSIIIILLSIFLYFQWSLQRLSDIAAVWIWAIPATYYISSFSAASTNFAMNMVYIQLVYATFFLTAYYLAKTELGTSILRNAFMTSAYFIVLFGMMNWLGNKETAFSLVKWFASAMKDNFYLHAVMEDSNGPRLTSVFQYANTYAGFLIGVLFCSVFLLINSSKWYSVGIHSFMVVPIIISFFVTLSRGGFVILPAVLLLVLPFLKPQRQVMYLLHLLISFILSFTILTKLTTIGVTQFRGYNTALASSGWLSLLLVSLLYTGISIILQRYVSPWVDQRLNGMTNKRWGHFVLPLAAVILGGIGVSLLLTDSGITKLLPENIRIRVENINFQQHSVLERGTFYMDAMKLVSDYPLVGAGGGAWAALYEKYQNNPYTSRQAHNFYLQYLTESGILGLTVFLVLLILVFYIFIKNYIKQDEQQRNRRFIFYIISISLLVHSALDFDLSYVYLGLLLFLSLGTLIATDSNELSTTWKDKFSAKGKWVYPSIILLVSLIFFFRSIQMVNANSNFNQSRALGSSGQSSLTEILTPLNSALSKQPSHPDYVLQKVALLLQAYNQTKDEKYFTEADTLLQQARQKEPSNYFLTERQIYNYITKEKTQKALELANTELNNFPWKVELYELSISLNTDLGHKARESGNAQQQNQHWDAALATLKQFEEKQKHLATLPKEQGQGNPFNITPRMSLALGQIYFFRGNHAEAENKFKNSIGGSLDDAAVVQNIRWYLAALQKQGKNDQPLMDKLLAKDPTEKQKIESLVNAKL
ncbi:O-antigen polymerase [Paenibacillus mucilaginosus 3016]|uniref:O-antigen polymerase n=1 Tax=Paenibacillus mucilaginosus 3016 TaxID=1116391 RepID=H6NSX1_9BACL|nr:O-antigen ligase family protein [Paenibacillus mucilaginosus]AFC27512.1 O-antigen polymerase [Paenibacillus mucilaginosus 3016]WFA16411.1 O-antigen ligase domain-containing protein [Paenibacillus mucilaginosus]